MFKQIILPILAVVIFIIIVGLFVQKSSSLGLSALKTPTPQSEKTIAVGSKKIQVQIAETAEKRTKGLSGVASLKADSGMLFMFDAKGLAPIFWMKDMLIPLDMIWIRDGKIVKIDKNVPIPTPGTPENGLKTYSAGQTVDYVLEVNAGFSNQNNIKVGDSVDLSGI
ncbi:MAG: DUF192 domain-containing protein [Candidatus Woesebacteria bacterium]|nr:DUF192 domain-containing protein [Candidatus Woesebacteria bacterium]